MPAATLPRLPDRRASALALTVLAHVALLLAWHTPRQAPTAPETMRRAIQWITLPPLPKAEPAAPPRATPPTIRMHMPAAAPAPGVVHARAAAPAAAPSAPLAPASPATPAAPADAMPAAALAYSAAPAEGLLERARRAAGAADRALRKENRPYIVAPPDSPQIRMQKDMQAAADLAPNAWYQAPKTAELVNQTGDGARRDRVITGAGTYCVTERAPTTSIDMIEKHGKLRLTNCPQHEAPANPQAWRTARD